MADIAVQTHVSQIATLISNNISDYSSVLEYPPPRLDEFPLGVVQFGGFTESYVTTGSVRTEQTYVIETWILYEDASTATDQMETIANALHKQLRTYRAPTYSGVLKNLVAVNRPQFTIREYPIMMFETNLVIEEDIDL